MRGPNAPFAYDWSNRNWTADLIDLPTRFFFVVALFLVFMIVDC